MKVRPQILATTASATLLSMFAMYVGLKMEAVEIVTAVLGAAFGFLGGVSLKVLENE
jgi:hypothetical protein